MSIEGRLTIDLSATPEGVGQARIASSRALGVARVFVGKTADETVRTLPLMFSVCGVAQGAAAAQACERAVGIKADRETEAVRALLVAFEALREHLLRVVMDWRRFLGLKARTDDPLRVMRLCAAARRTLDPDAKAFRIGASVPLDLQEARPFVGEAVRLVEELVVGEPLAVWRARTTAGDLEDWAKEDGPPACGLVRAVLDRGWADAGRADVRFLPELADDVLAAKLFGAEIEAFVAAPTWDGVPRETSAFARQAASPLVADVSHVYGSALLARLTARLVDIVELPRAMSEIIDRGGNGSNSEAAGSDTDGRGLGQVEAARGRLVHGAEIEGNMVRSYVILAPTEWNFHAAGGAAQGLADIAERAEDVHEIADLFVTSVDPCVAYEVRVA